MDLKISDSPIPPFATQIRIMQGTGQHSMHREQ
jgi:hypothetical protein